MDILLLILAIPVVLIVLLLIAALFVKKDFSITRDIVIKRPVEDVFDYVRHLRNQDHYSKWVMRDPQMKKDFRGVDGTVGFVYKWNSDKDAGEGEQEIIGILEGKKIEIEIRFLRPFKSVARTPIVTESIAHNQTKVTWGMEGTSKYPMNMIYVLLRGSFEKDLDTSLRNLREILEGDADVKVA